MKKRVPVATLLFEYDERLGDSNEPVVLTLTEKKGFIPQEQRFKKRLATEDTSNYKVVRKFDIAYNQYLLWAGAIAQNKDWQEGIVSPAYPTFRVREGFDPRYVDWLLKGEPIRLRYDAISFGAVPRRRRAKVSDFLSIDVPEPPPLSEQKRIAAILDAADALRAKRRETLAQLDTLLQSTFLDMFGDPVTNPMGWALVKLGDCGAVITGNTPSRKRPEYYGDNIEWIKSDNINNPSFIITTAEEHLSEKGVKVARIAPKGSILVTCIAGSPSCIGNAAVTNRKVAFNQQINAFVPSEKVVTWYVFGVFFTGKNLIQKASTNSMKGMVSKSAFSGIQIPLPPLPLQRRFAAIVESAEQQKSRLRAHLTELDTLFASLQDRAFKGAL